MLCHRLQKCALVKKVMVFSATLKVTMIVFLIKHINFLFFSIAISKARKCVPAKGKDCSENCVSSCCNNNNQSRKSANDK